MEKENTVSNIEVNLNSLTFLASNLRQLDLKNLNSERLKEIERSTRNAAIELILLSVGQEGELK